MVTFAPVAYFLADSFLPADNRFTINGLLLCIAAGLVAVAAHLFIGRGMVKQHTKKFGKSLEKVEAQLKRSDAKAQLDKTDIDALRAKVDEQQEKIDQLTQSAPIVDDTDFVVKP